MTPYIENPWLGILAVAAAVLGVGRLARVITYDEYPPAEWLRRKLTKLLAPLDRRSARSGLSPWSKIATCFWCATPWVMLFAIGWFFLGLVVPWIAVVWWVFWSWLGLSWVSSIILARDEPE